MNPEIRYGSTTGGIPKEPGSPSWFEIVDPFKQTNKNRTLIEKELNNWCQQLGLEYKEHTTGRRAGYCVYGCKDGDESKWKWCDCEDDYWYNQSLDLYKTELTQLFGKRYYITSITCE